MSPTTAVREGALLGVLAPAVLLVALSSDMVTPVLPAMGAEFAAGEAQLAWVVTGFLLVFAIGIPLYGRISDAVGLRRLFGGALLGYLAGAVVCALAPGLLVLVAGRVVMGAGAAAIPVLSIVAVSRMLPPGRRAAGIGVISAGGGVGAALGPVVGGAFGQFLGWPALFWFTVAYGAVLLPGVLRVLTDGEPGGSARFDVTGGVALGLAAGLLLLGVTQASSAGPSSPTCWGPLAAGLAATAAFGWRTARAATPFVPPSVFRERRYVAAVLTIFLAMFANLSVLAFVPGMVVGTTGLGPGTAGLVMIPGGVAVAVLSPLAGRLVVRTGTRPLVACGLAVMAAAALLLSVVAGGSLVLAALGVLGIGTGFALVVTTTTAAAADALPASLTGVGLGIFQGAQFLGAGAGPALVGTLLATRRTATDAISPLHEGGAVAFSDAFSATALIAVLALVVTWTGMRRPRPA